LLFSFLLPEAGGGSLRGTTMKDKVELWRDEYGVPHVRAEDLASLYWGFGYVHGRDRGLQLLFMRILGQGRVSELLDPGESSLVIDLFFRRMNWSGRMEGQERSISEQSRRLVEAYCAGINRALEERFPWELRLLGVRPEPWRLEDSLLLSRMTGYLTLAQTQAEVERLLVEMVQAGVPRVRLDELFPGILAGLDEELLRQVALQERMVPSDLLWGSGAPAFTASNSWVVAASRSASGRAVMCNDTHLETNRLPNIWSEVVLETSGRWAAAATMPGLPALIVARTPDLAWGATYPFMDAVDSWIERCRQGEFYREGEGWMPFQERRESILRKGKAAVETVFYENEHGVLDGDPRREGLYLSTRWASAASGGPSLDAAAGMWEAGGVAQGMELLGRLETAWSWVLADREGNIGFQMSGLLPRRRPGVSGFVPLPGWDRGNDWQGFVDPHELPRALNPEEGFFITANHDQNEYGRVAAVNICKGPYRAERIRELLAAGGRLDAEAMRAIQLDLYSTQAARFMQIMRPLLPDTAGGRLLREWDGRYDPQSRGATLFERVYGELYLEVFGKQGLGEAVMRHLKRETGIFVDYYINFDRVLLSQSSAWFGGENRGALYRRALQRALGSAEVPGGAGGRAASGAVRRWGREQRVVLSHILFGGKLPRFLGFDRGPIVLPGGRATVSQGQIYRSGGRTTTFAPSLRAITDFAEDSILLSISGGPSDRRFSRWYCSDLKRWQAGRHKRLRPGGRRANRFP
jgi:penicillin amidase